MKEALVYKSTGSWYELVDSDGNMYKGRIRGKLRLGEFQTTNPVAVGDRVNIIPEPNQEEVVITDILPRRNYIVRKSNNLSWKKQIIAANLDQVALVVTLATPATSLGFIDRFLLTAEAYHIPALIVFNKIDIYQGASAALLNAYEQIYERIGYDCLQISAHAGTNLHSLLEKLQGKTTLFSGHSGVGKSTLLNALAPHIQQKTADISNYSQKGKHTTTFAEMFHIDPDTRIIDTPGIKDFGVVDLAPQEISHYFKDMKPFIGTCRFNDCKHTEEPGCRILEAVQQNKIAPSRYYSYLSILSNEDAHH